MTSTRSTLIPKFGEFFANDEDSYQYLAESIRKHPRSRDIEKYGP